MWLRVEKCKVEKPLLATYASIHSSNLFKRMWFLQIHKCNSEPLVQFRSRQSDETKAVLVPFHVNSFNTTVESLTAARIFVIPPSLPYPESGIW